MKQPVRNSSGIIRCNYNGLIQIATAEDKILTETSIINLRDFKGRTQEVMAGEVTFFTFLN